MRSIRTKILIFSLIPMIVVLTVIGCVAVLNKEQSEKDLTSERLASYRSLLESGNLSFESLRDVSKLEELLQERVEYAEIIKKDLSTLYSTNSSKPLVRDEQDLVAIQESFKGVETTVRSVENGEALFEYFSPIIIDKKIVASLRIELLYQRTNERVFQYALFVIAIALGGILICYFLIALLLSTAVLHNIGLLKDAALRIEQGDLETPVVAHSKDEIGELEETLEQMRKEVKGSRASLEVVNRDLEKQVAERTTELSSKLGELERLNSFMVDREVKMIQLKKRIHELEGSKGDTPQA